MNHEAIEAHMRLLARDDLRRRNHESPVRMIPQGSRVPGPMKNRVRELLRTRSLAQVAEITGLHVRTIARIRDDQH